MKSILFATAALVALSAACHPVVIPVYVPAPETAHEPMELLVWSDPAALLPAEEVLKACRSWRVFGIRCTLVSDLDFAALTVSTSDGLCTYGNDGWPTNAVHWESHKEVHFRLHCFRQQGDDWDAELFGLIARRSMGRAFGILADVPPTCVDISGRYNGATRHPSGRYVCGLSMMNDTLNPDVCWPTPADALAYDLRDRQRSLLRPLPRD